jgi:hypothetical protein
MAWLSVKEQPLIETAIAVFLDKETPFDQFPT